MFNLRMMTGSVLAIAAAAAPALAQIPDPSAPPEEATPLVAIAVAGGAMVLVLFAAFKPSKRNEDQMG